MSVTDSKPALAPEDLKAALRPHLFPDPDEAAVNTFAVLDGAAIPGLLDHLYADPRPEFICLYRGELAPDMAEVAPYLVRLDPDAPFTDWLLTEGWGKHWGIFVRSTEGVKAVRTHFRKFLMVKDPEGNQIYFRFYDPRVLAVFLPTCNAGEVQTLFGPLNCYLCEATAPTIMLQMTSQNGQLINKELTLTLNT